MADDIGEDIKFDVLKSLGSPVTITKSDGSVITGEFVETETYPTHSTFFVRQYCLGGTFAYDSQIESGDLAVFTEYTTLVMNLKPEFFENAIITKEAYLIICNKLGAICKKESVRNSDQTVVQTWVAVKTDIHGLQHELQVSSGTQEFEDIISVDKGTDVLFIQNSPLIKRGMRWYPDASNLDVDTCFIIESVSELRLKGLLQCVLSIDRRE